MPRLELLSVITVAGRGRKKRAIGSTAKRALYEMAGSKRNAK
jgi:hypothetical protein